MLSFKFLVSKMASKTEISVSQEAEIPKTRGCYPGGAKKTKAFAVF